MKQSPVMSNYRALFYATKTSIRAWIADKFHPEIYHHSEGIWIGEMDLLERMVRYCLANQIISEDEIMLLRYCIEKRVCSIVVIIPLIILSTTTQDYRTGLSFIFTFVFLRERTNGFHLHSFGSCFVASLLLEILILNVVLPRLSDNLISILGIISAATIWHLAPYNHPNMGLSSKEIKACQRCSRFRLLGLIATWPILWKCNGFGILQGMMMGTSLVAVLLSLAYIIEWRNNNDEF